MRWLIFLAVTVLLTGFFLYVPSAYLFILISLGLGAYSSGVWVRRSPEHAARLHEWGRAVAGWARIHYALFIYGGIMLVYFMLYQQVFDYAEPVYWNDSVAYLDISQRSLLDSDFWVTVRPFTIPLIYKLIGGYGELIALRQWQIAMACWVIFAWSVARTMRTPGYRFPAFAVILLFSLSLDITLWNTVVHSESLSISLFVLMLASWFLALDWLQKHPNPMPRQQVMIGVGLGMMLVLWSFARDVHAYFVVGSIGLLFLVMLARWRLWVLYGVLAVFGVSIYFIQDSTANAGQRWQAPLANVLGQRVLVDPARTEFMRNHGMPYTPEVQAFRREWSYTRDYKTIFGDWLMQGTQAKRAYMRLLLSDPLTYLRETRDNRQWLFDHDLRWYAHLEEVPIPGWQTRLTALFYPKERRLERFAYVAAGLIILSGILRLVDVRWLVPINLLLLVWPIAFVVWHGDAMEMDRHAVGLNVQAHLGILLVFLLALDSALAVLRVRLARLMGCRVAFQPASVEITLLRKTFGSCNVILRLVPDTLIYSLEWHPDGAIR
ncbi:MAG: hypothetical protein KJ064_03440 [Anaerolineae bacterium]|nr:hypothetical protein [Anaerolineae bacterium]